MTLALQAAPLLLLLGLLASGRAGPLAACGAALLVALPAIAVSLPHGAGLAAFLTAEVPRALWLAAQPMAIVAGGLLFHAAVQREASAAPREATPARVFAVAMPLGCFLESVTGFAVGGVFALAALRAMGVRGPVAIALALQALVLVPWGGLGPGTLLGATLTGLPPHEVARVAAWPTLFWLPLLAPLLWWLQAKAGLHVPAREKAMQALMLAVLGALILALHWVLPFEAIGVVAAGLVATWALWRADPPRDLRAAFVAAAPYVLLAAALLGTRVIPDPPALRPFADLPSFPATHVAVVLWAVALALLALRPGARARLVGAMHRAGRPMAVLLLYVTLGRLLAAGGVAAALARAIADTAGASAWLAMPPLGFLAGFVTGSGVGGNAALMPVQAALGAKLGLPSTLAPGVHNFVTAAGAGMSVGVTAMLCALQGEGTRPGAVWRLVWPSMAMVVALGAAALWLMR
jgi:lactate permease